MSDEVTSVCGVCGASVYKQHIDSGIARYVGEKLMCTHCLAEQDEGEAADAAFEPIEFDDDDDISTESSMGELSSSKIHSATAMGMTAASSWDESKFKRALRPGGDGATRCRTFHCKLSDGALDFMFTQMNEWLDSNEEIVLKFVNSVVGPFEGKHTEQNLIVTAFY